MVLKSSIIDGEFSFIDVEFSFIDEVLTFIDEELTKETVLRPFSK